MVDTSPEIVASAPAEAVGPVRFVSGDGHGLAPSGLNPARALGYD